MKFKKIDFFLCTISVLVYTAKLVHCDFLTTPKKNNEFATSESRNYYEESYANNNKAYNHQQYTLPITFHPPPYNAYDYWRIRFEERNYNRNTFFVNNANDEKKTYTKKINSFDFERPSFEKENHREYKPAKGSYYNNHRYTTSARPFECTSGLRYIESHYIPPPKPIRASVIKLETITRPYFFPSNDYHTTPKYYPHVESLLNQVVIENLKNQYQLNSDFNNKYKNNPFLNSPAPVLSKPPSYTTVRPDVSSFDTTKKDNILTRKSYIRENEIHTYPTSVQDQLPPLAENVKIPYLYETTISSFLYTPTHSAYNKYVTISKEHQNRNNFIFSSDNYEKRNTFDIGILNRHRVYPSDNSKTEINNVTTIKNFRATENLRGYKAKRIKPEKSSVEVVSNLTVDGLSKNERENANIQSYINFYNRGNLIPYKTEKSSKFSKSPFSEKEFLSITKPHSVNLNDELSLDVKILKDTNWDGFTTTTIETTLPITFHSRQASDNFQIPPSTKESVPKRNIIEPSTRKPLIQLEIKKVNDFWEIENENDVNTTDIENESESYKINKIPTTTIITTEAGDISTTETFTPIPTSPTLPIKETTTFFFFDTTIPQHQENDFKEEQLFQRQTKINDFSIKEISSNLPSTTEHVETTTVTEKPSTFFVRRNYRRRPKVTVFTSPRTSTEKLQAINRNYFSKRQKPNITLAFGNKNIITGRPNYKRDEMLHFSDEIDIRKRRRKSGKRRQIYKRMRNATSEILLANDNKLVAYNKK